MKAKIQEAIDGGLAKADENGDGTISKEEFIFLISGIDDNKSDLWISNLYRAFDTVGTDKAKWEPIKGFLELWRDHYDEIENEKYNLEILKIFYRAMDKDRNGIVSLQELTEFHKGFNPNTTVIDNAKLMRKMDSDMTGNVKFYEYCKFYGIDVPKNESPYRDSSKTEEPKKSSCCLLI